MELFPELRIITNLPNIQRALNGNTSPVSDRNVLLVSTLIIHLALKYLPYPVKIPVLRFNSLGDYRYKPYVAI
jgi:hypothetical protein